MTKITAPISPPITDDKVATAIASPANPFFANGYPSSEVATAAVVPGIFSNIAALEPPYTPPICAPSIAANAGRGSHEKVKEISKEQAIETDNPGIAPTYIPKKTKSARIPINEGFKIIDNIPFMISTLLPPYGNTTLKIYWNITKITTTTPAEINKDFTISLGWKVINDKDKKKNVDIVNPTLGKTTA